MRRALRAASVLIVAAGIALAQAEDDESEDGAAEAPARFEISESAFDSWVFNHGESETSVRSKLEAELELRLDDIDRACKLEEPQRRKLELAGRGDIKRYFNEVGLLRRRFTATRVDPLKLNDVWKEIRPLQVRVTEGLFDDGSLLEKTRSHVLTAEQAASLTASDRARRAFLYRAQIEWLVAMFDNVLPLDEAQREKLTRLLVEKTRPPRRPGDYDFYVILWQASQLPDEVWRPWLDPAQLRTLEQQFTQLRGIERFLREHRRLALDGDPPDPPAGEAAQNPQADGAKP